MGDTRIEVVEPCGHEGSHADDGRLLDGMERHPLGPWGGEYNRGGGRTYDRWCPGGSRRTLTPGDFVLDTEKWQIGHGVGWLALGISGSNPGGTVLSAAEAEQLAVSLIWQAAASRLAGADHTEGT